MCCSCPDRGGKPHSADVLRLSRVGAGVRGDDLSVRGLPESQRYEEVDHRNERCVSGRDGGVSLQIRD